MQCNPGYAREVSGVTKSCVECVAGKYKETIGDDECTVRKTDRPGERLMKDGRETVPFPPLCILWSCNIPPHTPVLLCFS